MEIQGIGHKKEIDDNLINAGGHIAALPQTYNFDFSNLSSGSDLNYKIAKNNPMVACGFTNVTKNS